MSEKDMNELPSLTKLLTPERVKLDCEVSDWKEAIREAGKLLFQTNAVKHEYIEAMVETAQELGPYIVIAKGIALPHAQPERGAVETALSLVSLNPPIEFGNPTNDPVRIVIGLSAVNEKVHMRALQALAEIFLNDELLEDFMNINSIDSLTEIMKKAQEMSV